MLDKKLRIMVLHFIRFVTEDIMFQLFVKKNRLCLGRDYTSQERRPVEVEE